MLCLKTRPKTTQLLSADSRWQEVFKDPMTTAAAIDRLVHHSVILELNVESYRAQAAKARVKQQKAQPTEPNPDGSD